MNVFFISYYLRSGSEQFRDFQVAVKNYSSIIWNYDYIDGEDVSITDYIYISLQLI